MKTEKPRNGLAIQGKSESGDPTQNIAAEKNLDGQAKVVVPDHQHALHFLTLLAEGQGSFTFQTFDDSKTRGDKSLVRMLHGSLEKHRGTLDELNERGAGVYVTVNETDLRGRKLENIIRPRAVFQEADRPGTPEPPLTSHITVESSPGKFHRYLLIDDQESVPWDEWDGVMRRMVAEHGSDPSAKDRARVLRLPGYYHMKNPSAPHMVRITSESSDLPFSWGKITAEFPPMDEPDIVAMFSVPRRELSEPMILAHALRLVSPDCDYGDWLQVLMALHHASGGGADGLILADDWSKRGKEYKKGEVAYKWKSFGKYQRSPVTEATIYARAMLTGWTKAQACYDLFDKALEITNTVINALGGDPTAHLTPSAMEAFSIVRAVDEIKYERLRENIKLTSSKVRLGALDKLTKALGVGEDKQSFKSALTELAVSRCVLYHDADGNGYASFSRVGEHGEHIEHWALGSTGFREWLGYLAHSEMGEAPSSEVLRAVTIALTGIAKFDGEELAVFTRVAHTESGHWIDIGDEAWRAILVTATGWQIVQTPPVKFVRSKSIRPLPTPERGGDIAELWSLCNIPESDRLLVQTWIIEALRSGTPYPVLELVGEQGSAKSTTQAYLRRFIDNSKVLLRGKPKTVEDIFVSAAQNHVVSYENLSSLGSEMSDAICSVSTGAGYASRQLFTNGEESTMTAHNPVMLNGICAVVTRPDLLDRTIAVVMPVITARQTEAELDDAAEQAQGRIMGAILDLFSGTLAKLPSIKIDANRLPRMADFAVLGEAMSQHLGKESGVWLKAYAEHRRDAIRRTIDSSPVATAVMDFVGRGEIHSGTFKELLKRLNEEVLNLERGEYWPKTPKGLADSLRRVAPALRQIGISVSIDPKQRRDGIHCKVMSIASERSEI